MYVYLAAPFFNKVQFDIVQRIESLLTDNSHSFYSPRIHSGSNLLSPEDRRDPQKWEPVLKSNINELHLCDIVLAVFEYAMPHGHKLTIGRTHDTYVGPTQTTVFSPIKSDLELPDNGVVFECGYAYAKHKPIFGFHSKKQLSEMNLMLSHTVCGMITGFDNLNKFLEFYPNRLAAATWKLGIAEPYITWPDCVETYSGEVI